MEISKYWRLRDVNLANGRPVLTCGNGWDAVEMGNSIWILSKTGEAPVQLPNNRDAEPVYPERRKFEEHGIPISIPSKTKVTVY